MRRSSPRLFFGPGTLSPDQFAERLTADRWKIARVELLRDAPFAGRSNEATHVLDNGLLRLGFDAEERGLGLRSLYDVTGGIEHLQPLRSGARLWRLELRDEKDVKVFVDNLAVSERSIRQKRTERGNELTLRWRGIDLEQEQNVLDVTATVLLPHAPAASPGPPELVAPWGVPAVVEAGLAEWRIKVDNRSKRFGMWEAVFPIMPGPGGRTGMQACTPTDGVHRVSGKMAGDYPRQRWKAQFIAAITDGRGVYLAAHDPGARRPAEAVRV